MSFEHLNTIDNYFTPVKRKRSYSSPESALTGFKKSRENMELSETVISQLSLLLDEKLKNLPQLRDFQKLDEKIGQVIEENASLVKRVTNLETNECTTLSSVEYLLRKTKEKNLIFVGLPDVDISTCEEKIRELCQTKLGVADPQWDRIVKLSSKLILVEFLRKSDVYTILHNSKNLKGAGVWIQKDLTKAEREEKKNLLLVRKNILQADRNAVVKIKGRSLHFQGKKFGWKQGEGFFSETPQDLRIIQSFLPNPPSTSPVKTVSPRAPPRTSSQTS